MSTIAPVDTQHTLQKQVHCHAGRQVGFYGGDGNADVADLYSCHCKRAVVLSNNSQTNKKEQETSRRTATLAERWASTAEMVPPKSS